MEHDVVAQTRSAVDADQDAVLDGGAEAHCQPVRPRARPLVIGPRVRDQPASFAKDVRGARCGKRQEERQLNTSSVSMNRQKKSQKQRFLEKDSDEEMWCQ